MLGPPTAPLGGGVVFPAARARAMHSRMEQWKVAPGWLGLAGGAVVVALTFMVVVPHQAARTAGLQHVLLRWGHPAAWMLLALMFLLAGLGSRLARPVGLLAALAYVLFVVALVKAR